MRPGVLRFAEIVSKGVRPLRDIACVTCSLNKEAERDSRERHEVQSRMMRLNLKAGEASRF